MYKKNKQIWTKNGYKLIQTSFKPQNKERGNGIPPKPKGSGILPKRLWKE